jgi:hypothetical protein
MYPQGWNPWIYNLLLGKTYNNTWFPSGPTQGYVKGRYSEKETRVRVSGNEGKFS